MPIYEYACPDCGHLGEHMQKLADAPIAACPTCGSTAYVRKISAAGFALKGSGWYVTDFKGGGNTSGASSTKSDSSGESKPTQAAQPACGAGACPACAD